MNGHRDLAFKTRAHANQTARVLRQIFVIDARFVVHPVEVRGRDELHEIAIPLLILREQREVERRITLRSRLRSCSDPGAI